MDKKPSFYRTELIDKAFMRWKCCECNWWINGNGCSPNEFGNEELKKDSCVHKKIKQKIEK